ncbi:hypothetical protein N7523_002055 [Penicillium sp. IBT 18751x]|nr:hypothetical protein N7523_002055 [Penicillium sp. IBT 18751x]
MPSSKGSERGVRKPKKEPGTTMHSQEALAQLLEEAQGGALPGKKPASPGEQDSAAKGCGDDQHSAHEESRDPTKPAQHLNKQDKRPEDPVNADDYGSRNVEMLDPLSEDIDDSNSGPAQPRIPDGNDRNDEPGLLVDFGNMKIDDFGSSHRIDGFGGNGPRRFFILRTGPTEAPRYVFRRTNAYETKGLKNLSIPDNRISQLKRNDENGEKHWKYTRENIDGGAGIAVEERKNIDRCYVQSPETWVKLKWKGIEKEDQKFLVHEHSWITKSDLSRLFGRNITKEACRSLWIEQEARYIKAMKSEGKLKDRSPSPFPLDIFDNERVKRERTRTQSAMPFLHLGSDRLGSVPTSKPIQSIEVNQNRAPVTHTTEGVKKEPEEQEISTIPPPHSPDQNGQLNNSGVEDSERASTKKRTPKKFNIGTYMAEMEKIERWDDLREAERDIRRAKALANWHHYRDTRTEMGDEEE